MALRGKEVRPLIDPDLHDKLAAMADYKQSQIAEFASRLLEKAIVGEWHDFKEVLERARKASNRLS